MNDFWPITVRDTVRDTKSEAATQMSYRFLMLVGRVGIEPTTVGLKDRCSTTELPARTCAHYTQLLEPRKQASERAQAHRAQRLGRRAPPPAAGPWAAAAGR
jgi:hypothetical protein